jgi:hypothetical protein
MPSDVIEPPAGSSSADGGLTAPQPHTAGPGSDRSSGPPPGAVAGSTSGDELSAFLTQARPDPMLGEYVVPTALEGGSFEVPGSSPAPLPQGAAAARLGDLIPEGAVAWPAPPADVPPNLPDSVAGQSPGSLDRIAGLGLGRLAGDVRRTGSSADALAALGLDAGLESAPGPEARARPLARARSSGDDDEPQPRGLSWATLLLASYSSAVSIGLVWVLWTGRTLKDAGPADAPSAWDAQPDPGRRAAGSRRIAPRVAVRSQNVVPLGKTLRIREIEVTPLAVTSGPVTLERTLIDPESTEGGSGALKLRIRVRNVSTDRVLAPLDEAYLREREPGSPDSYIETASGRPPIAPYPLAVESEWSIAGQEFRELKPGETLETQIVSAPDAVAATTPEMTWRIRLRTDLNHTDNLGVRFRADEVRAEP